MTAQKEREGYTPTRATAHAVTLDIERSAYDREHGSAVDARRTARLFTVQAFGWRYDRTATEIDRQGETTTRVTVTGLDS